MVFLFRFLYFLWVSNHKNGYKSENTHRKCSGFPGKECQMMHGCRVLLTKHRQRLRVLVKPVLKDGACHKHIQIVSRANKSTIGWFYPHIMYVWLICFFKWPGVLSAYDKVSNQWSFLKLHKTVWRQNSKIDSRIFVHQIAQWQINHVIDSFPFML